MNKEFFPRQIKPQIYAYEDKLYPGLLKVGYTTTNVEQRVADQYPTLRPGELPYKIVFAESSMREDGSYFMDHDVHKLLKAQGFDYKEYQKYLNGDEEETPEEKQKRVFGI